MNYRNSVLLKHALCQGARLPRTFRRWTASAEAYRHAPPVLANSFPKSGTHLLVQILGILPGMKDWGDFWASQPSFSFREQHPSRMAARINRVAPGEMVSGHLHHSEEAARALKRRNVVHYFIYRDPRDVVVSEAHYLATMNRWHRLHGHFSRLPSHAERVMLSIRGLPGDAVDYPNVAARFERYLPWIGHPDVCAVNYEDLMSSRREEVLTRMMSFYAGYTDRDLDVPALVRAAQSAIQPGRSHTFRQGGSGGWRRDFDPQLKGAFKDVASNLLIKLGYERSPEW